MVIKKSEGTKILASLELHENLSKSKDAASNRPGEQHHVIYKPGTIVEDAE